MTTLSSSRVVRVLDRLFAEADASEQAMGAAVAGTDVSAMITSRTRYREYYGLLKEIPLPVSRETGALLYMLVRATRAQAALEFGMSFGVSTIYLAAALRDNGGGRVITTEFEASKVERARKNLTEAGLIDLVEIREGDALQTLACDLPETLDVVLLDGAKALYADVLTLVESRLRPGALVLADDARYCADFVNKMRAAADRYVSVPLAGDLEMAMRL
jgi:predicted O-methyltransferase YrrM